MKRPLLIQSGHRALIAEQFFKLGAVQFGAFRLKLHETNPDAPLSPYYFNLRTTDNPETGFLNETAVALLGVAIVRLCDKRRVHFTHVAGVPNAGTPLAQMASVQAEVPLIRLIKEEAGGKRRVNRVEPEDFPNTEGSGTILLVDDLAPGADSKIEAIEVLRRNTQFALTDVVVIIDREQGGADELARHGCRLHALLTLTELLDHYLARGFIDQAKYDEAKAYHALSTGP